MAAVKTRFLITLGLAALSLDAVPAAEPLPIETGKIRGVIFTPAQVTTDSPPWKNLLLYDRKKILFWTPSRALIDEAEKTLAARLAEIRADTPAHGFHFSEYYTPKSGSRDRAPSPPAYIYSHEFEDLSEQMELLTPSHPRQYIGATIDGRKALIIDFLGTQPDRDWKRIWKDAWHFYYLPASHEFTPVQFTGEMEDR